MSVINAIRLNTQQARDVHAYLTEYFYPQKAEASLMSKGIGALDYEGKILNQRDNIYSTLSTLIETLRDKIFQGWDDLEQYLFNSLNYKYGQEDSKLIAYILRFIINFVVEYK